jgi:hypothetical protein
MGGPQRTERLGPATVVDAVEHPAEQPERERACVVWVGAEPHRCLDPVDRA